MHVVFVLFLFFQPKNDGLPVTNGSNVPTTPATVGTLLQRPTTYGVDPPRSHADLAKKTEHIKRIKRSFVLIEFGDRRRQNVQYRKPPFPGQTSPDNMEEDVFDE